MSEEKKEKRKGEDRRSDGRRAGVRDRRIKQDPAWPGPQDRRKAPADRRRNDDRRKEDRRGS